MHAEEGELIAANDALPMAIFFAVAGIFGVVVGAKILVEGVLISRPIMA